MTTNRQLRRILLIILLVGWLCGGLMLINTVWAKYLLDRGCQPVFSGRIVTWVCPPRHPHG